MNKAKKIIPLFLVLTLLLSGCGNTNDSNNENSGSNSSAGGSNSAEAVTEFSLTDADVFTDRDLSTDYKYDPVSIQLNGSSASCDADTVKIDGSTITITDEGTYVFSGTLDNGMIIVNAEDSDKPQLVFDNVSITSAENAPLYILEANKVFVTLADGSTNTLSNGGTFTVMDDNNIDGTIYSKQDLTLNGSGSLTVESPSGHAIVCKDDLVFTSGTYTLTSSAHGIDANDSLCVKDANITISAGKDGAHVENSDDTSLGYIYISSGTFDITAEGDAFSAGAYVQIEDGTFNMLVGGGYENGTSQSSENWGGFGGGGQMPGGNMPGGRRGGVSDSTGVTADISGTSTADSADTTTDTDDGSTSMKGIKAETGIQINNGTFTIDSADDSLHSNTSMYINGGTFEIASGDDGIHAEETLTITGGTINISNSYEGLEALDITVAGGDISIQSTDDGMNAAGGTDSSGTTGGRDAMFGGGGMGGGMSSNSDGSIIITGGNIFMYAQGDGLDANGYMELTGGYIVVTGPTSGDTAILDYDTTATIDGATFIGVGSTMMAQTFSDGTQGTMAVQASANSGTEIRIEDTGGKNIVSFTPETAFACIIISTPDIVQGDTYTIYVGSESGSFEAS